MPKPDFYIKKGDRLPKLVATLVDENEVKIDLTGATSVKFLMIDPGTTSPKVDTVATILTPVTDGRVEYAWAAVDTDTEGDYDGEFEITWTGGEKTTFPNFRYLRIKIGKDIG